MIAAEAIEMQGWESFLAVAAVVLVIARQFMGRRLSWRMMVAVPAVLAYFAWREMPSGAVPAGEAAQLALELALAVACGIWQGASAHVYSRNGQAYIRGGWAYLAGWAVFVAGDMALHLAFDGTGFAQGLWVSLAGAAAVWAVRALVVALRTSEGAPVDARRA